MKRYRVITNAVYIRKYNLTYEVEANSEAEAKDKIDGMNPVDEEFFDENTFERVTDVDEIVIN